MARTFQIQRARVTGGGFQSLAPRSVTTREVITYDVLVSDPADPGLRPENITEYDVIAQTTGLPIVNENIFTWAETFGDTTAAQTRIIPWIYCTNKQVERDRQNPFIFRVSAEFGMPTKWNTVEEDFYPIAVPADLGGYPYLTENIFGQQDRVIWKERSPATDPNRRLRLPTNTLYSEPFMSRYPRRTVRQIQFEDLPSAPEDVVRARLFTTNDRAVFDAPPPTDPSGDPEPPRYMITDIEWQYMEVPVAAGPNFNLTPAYQMTYTFERSDRDGGWMDRRGLIDNYILRTANDLTTREAYRDIRDGATIIPALLNEDGTEKADQTDDPTFISYRVQPQGDWSFLRGLPP